MKQEEVKQIELQVKSMLDKLQNEKATVLFIGHETNAFVLSGKPDNIAAQIVFSMCRYPVVKEIIMKCARRFGELNFFYGDDVRNVQLENVIEINSGN